MGFSFLLSNTEQWPQAMLLGVHWDCRVCSERCRGPQQTLRAVVNLWMLRKPLTSVISHSHTLSRSLEGNTTKAAQFQAALERRLEAVQAVLWNEAAGVWLDFNLLKKQPNPAFYPSNLAPLWTDCFSDQAAAERAVQYLEVSWVHVGKIPHLNRPVRLH